MPDNVRRLAELGMVPPLAKEFVAQIDSGVTNVRRLVELTMVAELAKEVVTQISSGSGNVRRLAELGMSPVLSSVAASLITGGGVPPQQEAADYIARMSPAPSQPTQDAINTLVYRFKQCGAWPLIDILNLTVAENVQSVPLNLKGNTYPLTASAAPGFLNRNGIMSSGSQFYDTGFVPSSAGGNFQRDNASIGVYAFGDEISGMDDCGTTNTTIRSHTGDAMAVGVNQAAPVSIPLTRDQIGAGLTWASRDDALTVRYGKSADKLGSFEAASTALSAASVLLSGGRSSANPSYARHRIGAFILGASLTDGMWAAISNALDVFMDAVKLTTFALNTGTTSQTILGLGIELQSDSIEGDGGGIQESNTTSLPLGLSAPEQSRFASVMANFTDYRLAMGLYYRGTSSDGKRFVERLPGQNAAMAAMMAASGVSITFTYWSPPPYYKKNVVGGTTYRGSTYNRPDPASDAAAYNTWLRRLLQGGSLDAPDKATDPAGYASWMAAFAADTVGSMEYVHTNVGRIGRFCAQNEPALSASYPSCVWTNEQMYDFLKAIVPLIRASSVLSTYAGQPNTVQIINDDQGGASGVGSALIRADSALLAEIWGWSIHRIDECSKTATYTIDNAAFLLTNAGAKPSYYSENEDFDPRVDPSKPATYLSRPYRFANHAMQVAAAFRNLGSPLWYPIHIGKPSTGPAFETEGRAMTIWRPAGAPVRDDYPALPEGGFDFVGVNWNAMKGYLSHGIKGATRVAFSAQGEREIYGMAWRATNLKYRMIIINRSAKKNRVRLTDLPSGTFQRIRYTTDTTDVAIGAVVANEEFTLPPFAVEVISQN